MTRLFGSSRGLLNDTRLGTTYHRSGLILCAAPSNLQTVVLDRSELVQARGWTLPDANSERSSRPRSDSKHSDTK